MRSVEFKAELRDPVVARAIARSIGAPRVGEVRHVDTYFRVFSGRLKRRVALTDAGPEPVEYIVYERDDRLSPKACTFEIMTEEAFRVRFGQADPPEWVTVSKRREIHQFESARIHLDDVESLGRFIEFEALVTPRQNVARAHEAVSGLRAHFAPVLGEAISCSYADLLAATSA